MLTNQDTVRQALRVESGRAGVQGIGSDCAGLDEELTVRIYQVSVEQPVR